MTKTKKDSNEINFRLLVPIFKIATKPLNTIIKK